MVYQLIGIALDHNDWLMCGEWWYNSVHMFSIGIFFAMHEERIVSHLKKYFVLYLILSLLLLLPLRITSDLAKDYLSYYGEYWAAPFTRLRRVICLITEMLYSFEVVFLVLLLGFKIRIGNPFLKLMGGITLEFYLIHGLFVELLCYPNGEKMHSIYYIRNPFLFVLVVFVLALPSALLLKKLLSRVGK